MFSKLKERVGNVIFVFLLILILLIISMILEFNSIDLIYSIIVFVHLVRYLKLKLS